MPTPASTNTRYSAAWTTFRVVTTLMAENTMNAAPMPKAMFAGTANVGEADEELARPATAAITSLPFATRASA